jgi:hypothetical protein
VHYDVFNGDADGICALVQLRLTNPCEARLITGAKRDISLLKQVDGKEGDSVTVLDVSLDKNRDALTRLLNKRVHIHYVDHHFAGEIPQSALLTTNINTTANVCTSLLVNQELSNRYIEWAITGCYGDNLLKTADALGKKTQLSEENRTIYKTLGTYLNYNGYGASLDDLHFHPGALFKTASRYHTPQDFIQGDVENFQKLEAGYRDDFACTESLAAHYQDRNSKVVILPDAPWARRISGVYGNDLANQSPELAHAVLTEKANGNYLVSVRAPLNNKTGADEICGQFPTGGGRKAAAGINDLDNAELNKFITTFSNFYR